MPATIVARTLTISRDDDGSVRAIKGDMWQTTDDAGNAITPKHYGTKNSFTVEELAEVFPKADLLAQVSVLTTERNALAAERDAKQAELTALAALVEPLKEQIRTLKGVPRFLAVDLLKQITDAEKEHITQFVANDDQLRPLWVAFLSRVAGAPISLDSQTFLAALYGLRQALGEARVAELFVTLNIDLATGKYIDPAKAAISSPDA